MIEKFLLEAMLRDDFKVFVPRIIH